MLTSNLLKPVQIIWLHQSRNILDAGASAASEHLRTADLSHATFHLQFSHWKNLCLEQPQRVLEHPLCCPHWSSCCHLLLKQKETGSRQLWVENSSQPHYRSIRNFLQEIQRQENWALQGRICT